MLFQSYVFIFLFFPLIIIGYYFLNYIHKSDMAKALLIIASFIFYAYANKYYILLLGASILINYRLLSAMQVSKISPDIETGATKLKTSRKKILMIGVVFNLAVLFYYKYYGFFLSNLNQIFTKSYTLHHILLPLGISFFTFQQISILTDSYRGDWEKSSFLDYALYIACFPHLLSGPITLAGEMMPQYNDLERKRVDPDYIRQGLILFTIGLFKKVICADTFASGADWGYSNIAQLDMVNALLTILFFALQLYFDFSGYSDMALGVGKMLHLDLPINFNSPFQSETYGEFWRKWHMTLYRFMMRYIYIPLGGSRKGKIRKYINTLLVFMISGFWHGAQWTFFVWGLLNGLLVIGFEKIKYVFIKIPLLLQRLILFATFSFTTVFFRINRLKEADNLFRRLMDYQGFMIQDKLVEGFNLEEFWYVFKVLKIDRLPFSGMYLSIAITVVAISVLLFGKNSNQIADRKQASTLHAVFYAVIFVWCVISLSAVNSFIYFKF